MTFLSGYVRSSVPENTIQRAQCPSVGRICGPVESEHDDVNDVICYAGICFVCDGQNEKQQTFTCLLAVRQVRFIHH